MGTNRGSKGTTHRQNRQAETSLRNCVSICIFHHASVVFTVVSTEQEISCNACLDCPDQVVPPVNVQLFLQHGKDLCRKTFM